MRDYQLSADKGSAANWVGMVMLSYRVFFLFLFTLPCAKLQSWFLIEVHSGRHEKCSQCALKPAFQMSHLVEQISLVVYGVKFMVLIDQSISGLIEHNIMII